METARFSLLNLFLFFSCPFSRNLQSPTLFVLMCVDRLQTAVGNVKGLPPLRLLLGKHSVATCQVSASCFFFVCQTKQNSPCRQYEPSSQPIQKVRERRGGSGGVAGEEKREFVSPQGGNEWDGILQTLSTAEWRLSLWNKAFNLCLWVLCGVWSVRGRERKHERRERGVKKN